MSLQYLTETTFTKRKQASPSAKVTQNKPIAPYCTQSVKIGMIDSAINTKHSAFKGANIITQSFYLKG
ncbi:hypothetical protein ACOBV8_14550 [Pseudoalteromonas espejiana]